MPDCDAPAVHDHADVRDSPIGPGSGQQVTRRDAAFTNPVRLATVDSTNSYLRDAALAGAAEGTSVLADHQSAGHGRRGRAWHAPARSSLLCSVLFRPRLAYDEIHLLASAVGLAALDAARTVGVEASLKWPNDVVVGDEKLAGILSELVTGTPGSTAAARPVPPSSPGPLAVVVGIGLNVAWPFGWPPPEIAQELSRATTLERAAGHAVDREALAARLLAAVSRRYASLATPAGREHTCEDYRRACSTIGRDVRVELDRGQLVGRALDVRADGRLVVERPGAREVLVDAGDVVHLR